MIVSCYTLNKNPAEWNRLKNDVSEYKLHSKNAGLFFFNLNAGLRLLGKEVGLIWPKLGQSLASSNGSLSAETTLPIRVRGCVENSRELIEVDRKENFITDYNEKRVLLKLECFLSQPNHSLTNDWWWMGMAFKRTD